MKLTALRAYLDKELKIGKFADDAGNGLIVRGRANVERVGYCTNTTRETIRKANAEKVDFLLVHHGGWPEHDFENGRKKLKFLKDNGISLYISHAPLDCHNEFGTSRTLGKLIGLTEKGKFLYYCGGYAGVYGTMKPVSIFSLAKRLDKKLKTKSEYYNNTKKKIKNVAIAAGGTGNHTDYPEQARKKGCDTYICGEASSFARLYCEETKLNLICAGHTATELPAVKALAGHLKDKFGLGVVGIKEKFY